MQTRLPPDLTQKLKRVRRILQFKNGGYGHGKSQLITNLSSFRLLAETKLVSVAFTVKPNCTAPGAFLSLAAGHCYIVITNFAFSTQCT